MPPVLPDLALVGPTGGLHDPLPLELPTPLKPLDLASPALVCALLCSTIVVSEDLCRDGPAPESNLLILNCSHLP